MNECHNRWVMVGLDTSSPPVIFVVGTAGAGKSSLVTSFQRWSRFIETEAIAVNLDPGAERVHYDAEFDVRDVISLTEVMNEYDLGPNGAQILAADLVAAQALDVADELHSLSGELIIVDTPGQVELFAFREASSHLIEVLGQDQAAIIYLFDPMLSKSPSGFVSQMLLSSIVEFRLGLPTKNFLSKSDLLEEEDLEKYIYAPTKEVVDFIRTLNVPSICFPRNIKKYKKFVNIVNPDVISIDYNVNPEKILEEIDIPVQGGLNPEKLLEDKTILKQEVKKYLKVFKNHPYIFNLGHGVLPETNPNMVEYLIKFIKDN